MEKIKKIFGGVDLNWWKLILFAVISGFYTGVIKCVPFLDNTSFQDIAISYEVWVVLAVIVVVNTNKWWEAMLKCFVFFLISQPLVYIVEALFGELSLDMGIYYYRTIWLPMTFLTIPGGAIAYFCKKQNILGSIVLGLGNTILAFMGEYYLFVQFNEFPHHLLTMLFSFGSIFLLTECIQESKRNKLIAYLIPLVLIIGITIVLKLSGLYITDTF